MSWPWSSERPPAEDSGLRRAAYLAAVSGGSYIAGALSMVALQTMRSA